MKEKALKQQKKEVEKMNLEIKQMLEDYGLREGANSEPKEYVVEKAFLD